MTTLVTGATGFVGWHVARLLTERAGEVRVLVRPSSDLRSIDLLNVERISGDLREPASLKKALEGVRQVFHVAADYRLWARNPDDIYQSNVGGTLSLIDESRKAGVERFIYTSSVATIAVPAGSRLPDETTEASLDQMIGHYKKSKFLAEQEVLSGCNRFSCCCRESNNSDRTRRLETDADRPHYRRFPEWADTRVR